ncbi:class I SAM-dependent methyltransferase family protein [Antrihabitans cavernicola]|uniref:Methyltransferase domain-containing protein n=1 Tax=Antrihabitans cavernicola TaxID=2495913 RepID=A0A5A7S4I2_9NOCA|nr:class I SAM-dependent methyltransferase family protein [Spelaeibacter cavernicola]KAA0021090.1 hypothetical protein FOY51_20955 [Spelaeibacter cavernicola]
MVAPDVAAFVVPEPLRETVEEFKTALLAADRSIIAGRVVHDQVQDKISAASYFVTAHLREQLELDRDHESAVGAYFRETFPFFAMSNLIDRSFVKPRGYAGDYLTIEKVYDDVATGSGRLGRFVDRWFLDIPAARAVKNRRTLLGAVILDTVRSAGGRCLVTSLASGPAREFVDVLVSNTSVDLHATCVDIDDQALAHASSIAKGPASTIGSHSFAPTS